MSALGLGPEEEEAPEPARGEGVLPISTAAVQASKEPGTELDGTEVAGAAGGTGGRWVTLMRRRRPEPVDAEAPGSSEEEPGAEVLACGFWPF